MRWISREVFLEALDQLHLPEIKPIALGFLGLKKLGVRPGAWTEVRSKEHFREQYFAPLLRIDGSAGPAHYYKLFEGKVARTGEYSHGSQYTILREGRKEYARDAIEWQASASDRTNYNVRFRQNYITVVRDQVLGGEKIPLEAFAVYQQARKGPVANSTTVRDVVDRFIEEYGLTQAELREWFEHRPLAAPLLSPDELTSGEMNALLDARDPTRASARPERGRRRLEIEDQTGEPRNAIFFGPPGTGKSYAVAERFEGFEVFRVVFHPEYSYHDFVGQFKPVVGVDPEASDIIGVDGVPHPRPFTYYGFEPGPLLEAIAAAHGNPDRKVVLIIEEINRGECGAIFGDFFQLLDRNADGTSRYPIRPHQQTTRYLLSKGVIREPGELVGLPGNLWLAATLNSSDQSLFQLDSAFRRRWRWVPVLPNYDDEALIESRVDDPVSVDLRWLNLLRALNGRIVECTLSDDKTIGQWYVNSDDGTISQEEVRDKLLPFLWHDVAPTSGKRLFKQGILTLTALQEEYDLSGIVGIFDPPLATQGPPA